jgi:hypothetical protein
MRHVDYTKGVGALRCPAYMGLPKPALCSAAAVHGLILTWQDSRAFRGPRHPVRSQDSSRGFGERTG